MGTVITNVFNMRGGEDLRPEDDTRLFLEAMFSAKAERSKIALATRQPGKGPKKGEDGWPSVYCGTLDEALSKVNEQRQRFDCYLHVTSPRATLPTAMKETDAHELFALWAEIDFLAPDKPNAPKDLVEILSLIEEAGVPPQTFLVSSGRGYHAWWKLLENIIIQNDEHRTELKAIVAGFQRVLQATWRRHSYKLDPVFDLRRLLRLPGTAHYRDAKKQYDPDTVFPLPVSIVKAHSDPGRRYPLAVFKEIAARAPADKECGSKTTAGPKSPGPSPTLAGLGVVVREPDPLELVLSIEKHMGDMGLDGELPEIKEILAGRKSGFPSNSEVEWRIAKILLGWNASFQMATDAMVVASGAYHKRDPERFKRGPEKLFDRQDDYCARTLLDAKAKVDAELAFDKQAAAVEAGIERSPVVDDEARAHTLLLWTGALGIEIVGLVKEARDAEVVYKLRTKSFGEVTIGSIEKFHDPRHVRLKIKEATNTIPTLRPIKPAVWERDYANSLLRILEERVIADEGTDSAFIADILEDKARTTQDSLSTRFMALRDGQGLFDQDGWFHVDATKLAEELQVHRGGGISRKSLVKILRGLGCTRRRAALTTEDESGNKKRIFRKLWRTTVRVPSDAVPSTMMETLRKIRWLDL